MKKIIKDIISILTVILLVNIFSFFIFFRWDFTKTKRYSLSKVSKTSIRNNVEPIVVDFYVTGRSAPGYEKTGKRIPFIAEGI